MKKLETLSTQIRDRFKDKISECIVNFNEVTVELSAENLIEVCAALRDESAFDFSMLMDVCGVDYLDYGVSAWQTENSTSTGFSRGVSESDNQSSVDASNRFAVVYHLLSLENNTRLRLRVFLSLDELTVPSVIDIWKSADWFEREAFDLYGVIFDGHPDLRRILTDYGFVGHPFRKDFPLIGNVEMRYDAASERCVYEEVSIQDRTLVPKVIRESNEEQGHA